MAKDMEYHRDIEEQRRTLEAQMRKFKDGQEIMENRVQEMREVSERRDKAIREAENTRWEHSSNRTTAR